MMRDFYGKNGSYEIEEVGDDRELLAIYLNRPVIYERKPGEEKLIRSLSSTREFPDIDFAIDISMDGDSREYLINSLEVHSLSSNGVNEFVSALLSLPINSRDELFTAVENLLEEDDAVWGIVELDAEDD